MRGEGGEMDAFAPTPEAGDKANPEDEGECESCPETIFRGGLASSGGGPEMGEELSSFVAAPIS